MPRRSYLLVVMVTAVFGAGLTTNRAAATEQGPPAPNLRVVHVKNRKDLIDATVKKVLPEGILFIHSRGVTKVDFDHLAPEFQEYYGLMAYREAKQRFEESSPRVRDLGPVQPPPPKLVEGPIGAMERKEKVIRGQVFVTTRGGTNFKLGSVSIYLFGEGEFYALEGKFAKESAAMFDYYLTMSRRELAKENTELAKIYLEASRRLMDLEFEYFPRGPKTETDADGRFEITHQLKEPYVIVARATREVGDEIEHYKWIVPSREIDGSGRTLLSNRNMVDD